MKRPVPLRRGKPLGRTPWRRSARGGEGLRIVPLRRRRDTGPPERVRELVRERDGFMCVRCGTGIAGRPHSIHHRKRRGQGGRDDVVNLVTLCGSGTTLCHGWVHAHPAAAYDAGWLVREGDDPAEVSVLIISEHGTGIDTLLTADGGYSVAVPRDRGAA